MAEICTHGFRKYGGREVYCPEVAARPNGPGAVLTKLIDKLLLEETNSATAAATVSATTEEYNCSREFSYRTTAEGAPLGVMSDTTINIEHEANRKLRQHQYRVSISWLVASLMEKGSLELLFEKVEGPVQVDYAITAYDNGPVYGFISAPNLLIHRQPEQSYAIQERRLTTYDYIDLANELAIIHELDDSPWQDNKVR